MYNFIFCIFSTLDQIEGCLTGKSRSQTICELVLAAFLHILTFVHIFAHLQICILAYLFIAPRLRSETICELVLAAFLHIHIYAFLHFYTLAYWHIGIFPPRLRSETICELVLAAEESWRLNALCEAANAGFWLAKLVSR